MIAGEEDRSLSAVRDSIAWITFNNPDAPERRVAGDVGRCATALLEDIRQADADVRVDRADRGAATEGLRGRRGYLEIRERARVARKRSDGL